VSHMPDSKELAQLDSASAQLIDQIVAGLQNERGVHLETAIGAAGSLAGVTLLRATGVNLSELTAGSPVFVDKVNESVKSFSPS